MACTKTATGPCSLVPDNDCFPPPDYYDQLTLRLLLVSSSADSFRVSYDSLPSENYVEMYYRKRDAIEAYPVVRLELPYADSESGLIANEVYLIMIRRVETNFGQTLNYGPWYKLEALISDGWTSE